MTKRPYYIVAPGYTYKSSGVKALHLLCHHLNEAGYKAYLCPSSPGPFSRNPDLNTMTAEEMMNEHNYYVSNDFDAVVIYPDIIIGNPLEAKKIVRYFLAPINSHGRQHKIAETDLVYGYCAPYIPGHDKNNLLLVPTWDREVFYPNLGKLPREGACFYSHKHDKIHGRPLSSLTNGMRRLEGRPEVVADILRRSEVCYLYELSEVILSAYLCGCPTVLIRGESLPEVSLEMEADYGDCRWHDTLELVKTQGLSLKALESRFTEQLERFINITQSF